MKKRMAIVFLFLALLLLQPSAAFAIEDPTGRPNNKFGIHILFTAEVEQASKLVNSSGGDWAYVTIPIQSTDRNLEKWQKFMDDCRRFHIIPIIRIATYAKGNFWTRPIIFDSVDFANFLNSLHWPTKNRYVIVYNEPNSNLEWGGAVDAAVYAQELSNTIDAFKRVNADFFIISAGLDSHAPSVGNLYENSYRFLLDMDKAVPGIFNKIDGFASHSYPNRDFSADPKIDSSGGIDTYKQELAFIKAHFSRDNIPVFITETGWQRPKVTEGMAALFYQFAFQNVWRDPNIIAITPFLLNGQAGGFSGFSMLNANGERTKMFEAIAQLPKINGQPTLTNEEKLIAANEASQDKPFRNFRQIGIGKNTIDINPTLRSFLRMLFAGGN